MSLPPVPDIIRSAYATLVVTDLAEARRFWVDLLGFVVTYEDSTALYLRGYDELTHHNLIVRAGPAAAAGALGYRVRSAADLSRAEEYYAALKYRGVPSAMLRFDGEYHGTENKPSNWMRTQVYMMSWFQRYSANPAGPPPR